MNKLPREYDILFIGEFRIPIPPWANWIAMDSTGMWTVYDRKPKRYTVLGYWAIPDFSGKAEVLGPIPGFGTPRTWETQRWDLRKEAM